MMLKNPFRELNLFEICLWAVSVISSIVSFVFSGGESIISLLASILGVTALIFIAKGNVWGQVLCIIFSLLYAYVSLKFKYYGELITYLFMSAPMALLSLISWIRNPYRNTSTVKINNLKPWHFIAVFALSIPVTVIFYYLLRMLDTANLLVSTVSITTSFIAASLTFLRSPLYAIGYAANDIILIILWIMAAVKDISYLPMVICFVMFLANDMYGFFNWQRMKRAQQQGIDEE